MPEKRSYPRVELVAPIEIVPVKNDIPSSNGIIKDLSAGGIGIIGTKKLFTGILVSVNAELPLELKLEGLKGHIVRSYPIGSTQYVFIGVDFTELPPDKRQQFSKYVMDLRLKQYSQKLGV